MSINYNPPPQIRSFLFICALLGLTIHQVQSALTVNSTTTNLTALVYDLFPVNTTATISNINFVGDSRCMGTFAGGLSVVPGLDPAFPDEGVVLSTGDIENLPNQDSEAQTTNFGTPGDEHLDNLLDKNRTRDACVLEFDFECNDAKPSDVFLNYVFGSEEYLEYTGSIHSDVFALFLNGDNLAIVPNTAGTPIAVNSVNQDKNSEYFVSNEGIACSYPGIEMGGFTQKLTTAIGSATAGTNTLKIVIVDVKDAYYDSWVLLEAGSITCKRD